MSKPLIIVLQLIGLVLIVAGIASNPMGVGKIIIGLALAVVAGFAFRRRIRRG